MGWGDRFRGEAGAKLDKQTRLEREQEHKERQSQLDVAEKNAVGLDLRSLSALEVRAVEREFLDSYSRVDAQLFSEAAMLEIDKVANSEMSDKEISKRKSEIRRGYLDRFWPTLKENAPEIYNLAVAMNRHVFSNIGSSAMGAIVSAQALAIAVSKPKDEQSPLLPDILAMSDAEAAERLAKGWETLNSEQKNAQGYNTFWYNASLRSAIITVLARTRFNAPQIESTSWQR